MCLPMWRHLAIWIQLNLWFFRPTQVHNPNGKSIGTAVLAQLTTDSPSTYNGASFTQNCPVDVSEPPSNTWFPGPTGVLNPNGISIGSAVFAGLTSVTDRQTNIPTDHAIRSVRLHVHKWYGRCSVIINKVTKTSIIPSLRVVISKWNSLCWWKRTLMSTFIHCGVFISLSTLFIICRVSVFRRFV